MEKSPDEELVDTIYSACLIDGPNSLGKVYTERELKKGTEDLIGKGEIDRILRDVQLTLHQLLDRCGKFVNLGPGQWRVIADNKDAGLLESIADKKNGNRSSRGGRSGGGGGGSARGRGGASASQRGNLGGGNRGFGAVRRGNQNQRSHGSAFRGAPPAANNRPPPAYNRAPPPPQNDYSNQRPLVRPAPAAPPDYERDRDSSYRDQPYNRGPSRNSYYDEPRYDLPRTPPYQRSPSPPPGLSHGNHNSHYDRNEPRGYYVGPPSNRHPDQYDRPNNDYDNTYDNSYNDDYNNDRRGYNDNRGYNDRRRSPSPPPAYSDYRDRSPPRGNGYGPSYDASPYRDDRASDSRSNYNGSNYDGPYRAPSNRSYSPPPPPPPRSPSPVYRNAPPMEPPGLGSRHVPSQKSFRGDPSPPRRPDSRASNVSEYSQFSTDTNVPPAPSTSRQRAKERAEQSSSAPLKMEDLAAKFNAKVVVSEPAVDKSSPEYQVAVKVAEALRGGRRLFDSNKLYTYEAFNYFSAKEIQLPTDKTILEKEAFLAKIWKEYPELFKDIQLDLANDEIKFIDSPVSSAPPVPKPAASIEAPSRNSDFDIEYERSKAHVEDENHFIIMRDIRSIIANKFSITKLIDRLCHELALYRSIITEKVTYVLFVTFEGKYRYADGSQEEVVVLKNTGLRNPDYFEAPLVHDVFGERRDFWKVDVCRFMKFEKFSVRPVEAIDVYENIDKEINSVENPKIDRPIGGWKPNYGCLVLHKRDNSGTLKWGRGIIIRDQSGSSSDENRLNYRVLLLDQGHWVMVSPTQMRVMPEKFKTIPPCAIQCRMETDDEEVLMEMNLRFIGKPWRDTIRTYSAKTYITFTGNVTRFDGITTYGVQLFVEKLDGEKGNITELF
ncbi:CRE-RSD-6 protein [Caenorhabditis remanei]|uniref:CRE-RSD-6 protein n=1 Tax=Caenorhabditis remanei TaxID=31234 RepID=E3LY96_CAERE|nr:CRE-RSD-6 protein [Caenorhabditis remanei]